MRRNDLFALLAIAAVIAAYGLRLFVPYVQLIVTPDFGRSDAWHFSFGMKYALWQSLHSGKLPLWTNLIGAGYPLFAEGQTGALFLPNLLLFLLPNPVWAYNLALLAALLVYSWGFYALSKTMQLGVAPSFFAAITGAFASLPILHLTHITLLQGMSLMPAIVATTVTLVRKKTFLWIALWSFLVSQQIFAGFPQASILTLMLAFFWVVISLKRNTIIPTMSIMSTALILAIAMAAIQLLPSWEFLKSITNPNGFSQQGATLYSFPLKHLATFAWPFALGNPKNGTYPPFWTFDGSIFWENTTYIGIIAFLLGIWTLFLPHTKQSRFWTYAVIASLILAFGKYSPLYFVYSFWPLNLFRVPSRFTWITMIGIIELAGIRVSKWNRYLVLLITIANSALLINIFWSYHMLVPADRWMQKPDTAVYPNRYLTIGEPEQYNAVLATTGWKNESPFWFLREGLSPDSNIVWNVAAYHALAGRALRRPAILDELLAHSLEVSDSRATISASMQRYFDLFDIGSIISFVPVDTTIAKRVDHQTDGLLSRDVWITQKKLNRVYMVYEATEAATLSEAVAILTSDLSIPTKRVLLEQADINSDTNLQEFVTGRPQVISPPIITYNDEGNRMRITIKENQKLGILVVADTWYPGWQAFVDGKSTHIYPANLTQRAILVPPGTNEVTMVFTSPSFERGKVISIIACGVTTLLMVVHGFFAWTRTHQKGVSLKPDRSNSLDT